MDKKFKEAVDNKDLTGIRIKLLNAVMSNTDDCLLNEMINYAENNIPNLYDEHDGETFDEDIDTATEDIIANISNKLNYNFSKERLSFFVKVNKKYAPVVISPEPEISKQKRVTTGDYVVSSCMIIGGGIIIADGILLGRVLPVVAGSFIAAAGVVKLINDTVKKQ